MYADEHAGRKLLTNHRHNRFEEEIDQKLA
jgi:hypothetical protein